jgi:hypothetical protein
MEMSEGQGKADEKTLREHRESKKSLVDLRLMVAARAKCMHRLRRRQTITATGVS